VEVTLSTPDDFVAMIGDEASTALGALYCKWVLKVGKKFKM
jgi:hypothetical protein